jgi:small subunit ribosomal protein S21
MLKRNKGVFSVPKVVASPNESTEQLLRRFRKTVTRSGLMSEIRRRRWHVSKSEERRIEKKKAIRRSRRRGTNHNDM